MNEEVLSKIAEEIDNNKSDMSFVKIADYLKFRIGADEKASAKYLSEKDSLSKCFANIRSKAQKEARKGCACIEDAKVYKWAEEYYGLSKATPKTISNVLPNIDDLLD